MYQRDMVLQAWERIGKTKSGKRRQQKKAQAFFEMLLEKSDICWGEKLNETFRIGYYDAFDEIVPVLFDADDPYMICQSIRLADLSQPKEVEILRQFIRDCDPEKHQISLRLLANTGQPELLHTLRKKKQLPESVRETLGIPAQTKRAVYYVVPDKEGGKWQVKREGVRKALNVHERKSEAIAAATDLAKRKIPSQVKIHKRDGTFQREHTYGDDPRRYPG